MNWKVFSFLFSVGLILSITSCDAVLFLHYEVKNCTQNELKIKVRKFASDPFSSRKDTIVSLRPKESLVVGGTHGIGFPWESRNLYRENPFCNCFTIYYENEALNLDIPKMKWKYKNDASVLKLKKKYLVKH